VAEYTEENGGLRVERIEVMRRMRGVEEEARLMCDDDVLHAEDEGSSEGGPFVEYITRELPPHSRHSHKLGA
jgi:hypothetical protein